MEMGTIRTRRLLASQLSPSPFRPRPIRPRRPAYVPSAFSVETSVPLPSLRPGGSMARDRCFHREGGGDIGGAAGPRDSRFIAQHPGENITSASRTPACPNYADVIVYPWYYVMERVRWSATQPLKVSLHPSTVSVGRWIILKACSPNVRSKRGIALKGGS